MTRRSRAREVALQVLFQDDLNPQNNPAVGDALIVRRLRTAALVDFCRDLVGGVRRNRAQLDQRIEQTATNWSLYRMAVTDRNVLRIGAYELLFTTTPGRVVVNESVELAKRYGSAHSAPFVNGILDRLFHGGPASVPASVPASEVKTAAPAASASEVSPPAGA